MTPEQRHAQLRGPENPRARGYSPAIEQREAAAAARGKAPDPAAIDGTALEPAAPEKVQVGKYEVSEDELAALLDRQAQDDLRKATIPPTPDAYKLEISPDAKLPGSAEFRFDATDPSLAAARNWAHSKGLDQGAFSEMLTLYASHIAQQNLVIAEANRAEIAKAGVNGPQRVDAISKWIRAEIGDADAKPILATMVTDAHLRFFERMQQKVTNQGSASFSQSHRVPADTRGIPGYENMSFEQRRHAQDQQFARRNGG
ncbi:hypothetical protein [Bradyrhizobium sp. SSUT77]|uniref:hypothetical protein n=1 Tax=Bradyrhizobium sp. SSUT77 TaxID=3040603 RepID=UPI00244B25D5|nr:hypothetical protein [Bradyrhizobium sp. SSUT77]MDH2343232.1 hypothetical protein [Bradyrhizobium sp. SSUT77]